MRRPLSTSKGMWVQDMSMKEQMEAELQEMIRTLEKANGALARIFNLEEGDTEAAEWELRANLSHAEQLDQFGWCVCEGTKGEGQLAEDCPREIETATCTRCGREVESDSLVSYGDWKLCELCQGDI